MTWRQDRSASPGSQQHPPGMPAMGTGGRWCLGCLCGEPSPPSREAPGQTHGWGTAAPAGQAWVQSPVTALWCCESPPDTFPISQPLFPAAPWPLLLPPERLPLWGWAPLPSSTVLGSDHPCTYTYMPENAPGPGHSSVLPYAGRKDISSNLRSMLLKGSDGSGCMGRGTCPPLSS